MSFVKKILNYIVFENLLIALAAASFALQAAIELKQPVLLYPFVLVFFFGTFAEYTFHRYLSLKEKKIESNEDKVRHYFLVFILASIAVCVSFLFISLKQIIALLPFAILTIAYSFPFLGSENKFRLRDIPGLKVFLICLTWSIPTVLVPALQFNYEFINEKIILIIIGRLFYIFAITIPFDVRDMLPDKRVGVRTLPLIFGEARAWLLARISIITYLVISIIEFLLIETTIPVLFSKLLTALVVLFLLKNPTVKKSRYYYHGFLDGTIILQFLLMWLLSEIN